MATFYDSARRQWFLTVDAQALRRVRKAEGIDLLEPDNIRQLIADHGKLVDVLACLLADQIAARRLSAIDFARGMLGRGLDNAGCALAEELHRWADQMEQGNVTAEG